jgi:hypothetical protein
VLRGLRPHGHWCPSPGPGDSVSPGGAGLTPKPHRDRSTRSRPISALSFFKLPFLFPPKIKTLGKKEKEKKKRQILPSMEYQLPSLRKKEKKEKKENSLSCVSTKEKTSPLPLHPISLTSNSEEL